MRSVAHGCTTSVHLEIILLPDDTSVNTACDISFIVLYLCCTFSICRLDLQHFALFILEPIPCSVDFAVIFSGC